MRLPKNEYHFDAITNYVDRYTKRVHFLAIRSAATAVEVARDFYEQIILLHGLPDSIVLDKRPVISSKFWTEVMRLCYMKLRMTTSHHPQTDWLVKISNRMIENYLRCFFDHNQTVWDDLRTFTKFN